MLSGEIKFRVRYSHTDKMGYLYYGRYANFYEAARVELFRSLENCDFLLLSECFSFCEASSIKSVARYTESSIVTCEINSILYLFYYV